MPSASDSRSPCAVRSKQMSTPTLVDKVEAMAALACVKELTPAAIKIGLRLLHHFNCRTGRCDPGIEILAAATGLAERSVYRAIKELEAFHLFHIDHRRGRSNTNSYRPDFRRIKAQNVTRATGFDSNSSGNTRNLTAATQKPDNLSRKNPTAVSGEHVNEHINENMKEHAVEVSPQRRSNSVDPLTNFALQRDRQAQERDHMCIDWASWIRWLASIGVSKGTEWVFHAIKRAENEAHLSYDQGCLLVDRCLRKARATCTIKQSLEALLTEAIRKQQGKDMG